MMKRVTLTFLVLFILNYEALADIRYVNLRAQGDNSGTSWENAFINLQDALDVAVVGDEIWVARGTYRPTSTHDPNSSSPRNFHFRLINGVSVLGGFAGGEGSSDERIITENVTVLSGDIGSPGDASDNCFHVIYHPSLLDIDNSATLDGFTISGGSAYHELGGYRRQGGGMYNDNASPTLRNDMQYLISPLILIMI